MLFDKLGARTGFVSPSLSGSDRRIEKARTQRAIFVTSWDDGHPLDLRLAEVLHRHGFPATFFVPGRNRDNRDREPGQPDRPVVSASQLRVLGSTFEIGSHTLDHCYLNEVGDREAERQIVEGKAVIEDILGEPVSGFCYPGGQLRAKHRRMVREAGFVYARTIANLNSSSYFDRCAIPTTMQFYPHSSATLVSNYVRFGQWRERSGLLRVVLHNTSLISRLRAALDYVCERGGIFHLWGHSWEIEEFGGWALLDEFLGYVDERVPAADRYDTYEAFLFESNATASPQLS